MGMVSSFASAPPPNTKCLPLPVCVPHYKHYNIMWFSLLKVNGHNNICCLKYDIVEVADENNNQLFLVS